MKRIFSLLIAVIICISSVCSVCASSSYTVVCEPGYNMADSFYSNITKVSRNSAWAICDTNGYPLTGYSWEAMGEITDEHIPAKLGGLWGYISAEGVVLIPYKYQQAENFSEGLARVLTDEGKYAYIDKSGNVAFVSEYDYSFTVSGGAVCIVKDGLYGYCDTAGSIIIHPQFESGFDFCEGLAAVKFGGKWGYISTGGGYVVKPAYTHASDFKNGYAVCTTSSGYGIIDKSGKKLSSFTFDYIGENDSEGRFPAKSGDKCGYINAKGEWLLKVDYDFCYTFTNGIARVYKDGLWGYIDEQGEEIVAPVFFDCGEYRNGRAFYSVDGMTYGFLTINNVQKEPDPEPQDTVQDTVIVAPVQTVEEGTELPLPSNKEKCISMKVGNGYARKGSDIKILSHAPELVDGVTMVPLRDVVEYIGGTVTWNEKNKRISANCKANSISVTLDSRICYINGIPSVMTVAPMMIDGVTMIPVRNVVIALGCDLEWQADTQNIFIRY